MMLTKLLLVSTDEIGAWEFWAGIQKNDVTFYSIVYICTEYPPFYRIKAKAFLYNWWQRFVEIREIARASIFDHQKLLPRKTWEILMSDNENSKALIKRFSWIFHSFPVLWKWDWNLGLDFFVKSNNVIIINEMSINRHATVCQFCFKTERNFPFY